MIPALVETVLHAASLHFARGAMNDFSWFQLLPGMELKEGHNLGTALGLATPRDVMFIPTTWAIVAFILLLAGLARMKLNAAMARPGTDKYLPDARLTLRNFFEMIIEFLADLMKANLGEKEMRAFFPLVGGLFVFILVANFSGFVPGLRPPTDNLSSNFAMAITVFLVFNYAGLSRNGLGYLKHLGGPVVWLAPVFFVLETVSLLIRPMSLSMRLTVNIFVDHLLQAIARGLGTDLLGVAGAVILPVPLYFLGLLVCSVQAFVFALLTIIYISQSVAHEEGHGHEAGH